MTLRVWRLTSTGIRERKPFIDETSDSAACEVGGGPWDAKWAQEARMQPAVAATMRTPFEEVASGIESLLPFDVPDAWKPPGY